VQNAQRTLWHLFKALANRHLQGLKLDSTFCIFMIPACAGWVSENLILAVLMMEAK